MVRYTSTAGFKLPLDLECSFSSDWAKTRRPCIANISSRLDWVDSSLGYTANRLAVQSYQQAARRTLLAAKRETSSRVDCSGCLCFLCKSIHGPFCPPATHTLLDTAKRILPQDQLQPYPRSNNRGALTTSRRSTRTGPKPATL